MKKYLYVSLALATVAITTTAHALTCPARLNLRVAQLVSDPIARLANDAAYMRKADALRRLGAEVVADLEIAERAGRSCRYRSTNNAAIESVTAYERDITDPDGDEYVTPYITANLISDGERFKIVRPATVDDNNALVSDPPLNEADRLGRKYVLTKLGRSMQRIGYAKPVYRVVGQD